MLVKRGFIFLIFLLLVNISYAQENQCLLVNENNVDEAAIGLKTSRLYWYYMEGNIYK